MADYAFILMITLAWLAFVAKRTMTYLHILQQDDYNNLRLAKWIIRYGVFDKKLTLVLLLITGGWFAARDMIPDFLIAFTLFFTFALFAFIEKDPRKRAKKKLTMTTRARRIFLPTFILSAFIAAPALYFEQIGVWVLGVQALPIFLITVNYLLAPVEAAIQQRYWNEARNKVRTLEPTVVAITGSYGKTSIKHILGHILKTQAGTLVTPGSTNTAMGTARIIREELDEDHKYLVVEMGAYGPGSIDRLCALTPPDIGIISAVGHAHYERFKTLDAVARTKFELADAVTGRSGTIVVHERTMKFPYPQELFNTKSEQFLITYEPVQDGMRAKKLSKDHLQVEKIRQLKDGIKVTLTHEGEKHTLELPLFGNHHGHNAALAFGAARALGIEPGAIKTALKSVKQIQHRLEVKRQNDGTVIIDDAFNSNPHGFRSALDVLAVFHGAKRKILITPGMVEMGGMHEDAHEKIGRYAGQVCDVVLVVAPKRIPSFIRGVKATSGKDTVLLKMNRFTDAARWIAENKREGDVILLENDLPDLYERVPKL